MNIELLRTVQEHILEEPRRLNMGTWLERGSDSFFVTDQDPPCGTVACIAGWTCALQYKRNFSHTSLLARLRDKLDLGYGSDLELAAMRLLDIDRLQARALFHTDSWPWELRNEYEDADVREDRDEMAKIAAKRIDHFIETGE